MSNRIKLRGTTEKVFDLGLTNKQIFDASGHTANRTWVLPDSNGTNTYVLTTNGSGTLSWAAPATGTVTSVSGTAARITSTGGATPVIDIDATYVGQTSITTLGTITTGTWTGTAIAAIKGGTGQTVYAVGDILAADTTTTLSKVADVATGNALISGGVGVLPSYGKIGLTTHVSGTLAATSGGTAQSTYTTGDILYSSAANTLSKLGIGSTNAVLTIAAGIPAWSAGLLSITSAKTLTVTNSLTLSGTDSTTMTFPPASASVGYINIPQNSQSAAYTTVLADQGKHIYHPVGDAVARIFTIDSNANVAYVVGTTITFINRSPNNVTIAITSDTLTWSPTGATGSRTLPQYGVATATKITTTEWIITGVGLS